MLSVVCSGMLLTMWLNAGEKNQTLDENTYFVCVCVKKKIFFIHKFQFRLYLINDKIRIKAYTCVM